MHIKNKSGFIAMIALSIPTFVISSALTLPTALAASIPQPSASVGTATTVAIPSDALNAKFLDQNGVSHSLAELKGDSAILVPFLTLCGDTCPFTTANMLQLQQKLNQAHAATVKVIGIDVDPYRDSVARLKAYANLIGANFELWTAAGSTSMPMLTKKELAMKNPVGTGDINSNLLAIEKFLGYSVQVVPQGNPPSTDWMAPYKPLTYDINHSDGFAVIDPTQKVRFISRTAPAFTGTLSKTLATFMGYKSNIYKSPVYKGGWTPTEALSAIEWVTQTTY